MKKLSLMDRVFYHNYTNITEKLLNPNNTSDITEYQKKLFGLKIILLIIGFSILSSGLSTKKNAVSSISNIILGAFTSIIGYLIIGTRIQQSNYNIYKEIINILIITSVCTIALSERTKQNSISFICIVISSIIYPLLYRLYKNYSGNEPDNNLIYALSTLFSLTAIYFVGPRTGKYVDGQVQPKPGHNIPMFSMGSLIIVLQNLMNSEDPLKLLINMGVAIITNNVTNKYLYDRSDYTINLETLVTESFYNHNIIFSLLNGFITPYVIKILDKVKLDSPSGLVTIGLIPIFKLLLDKRFYDLYLSLGATTFFGLIIYLFKQTVELRVSDDTNIVENPIKGDRVVTSGGILGKIARVKENDIIELEISENVNVEIIKSAIIKILSE